MILSYSPWITFVSVCIGGGFSTAGVEQLCMEAVELPLKKSGNLRIRCRRKKNTFFGGMPKWPDDIRCHQAFKECLWMNWPASIFSVVWSKQMDLERWQIISWGEIKQSFTVKWVVFSPGKHVNVGQEYCLKFLRMRLGHNHSGK